MQLLTAKISPNMLQGAWVAGGMGASQLIRLAGNLILTRLLFAEAFGLVALAGAIILGLNMLSDVGLRGAVLKSKRSNDPHFMETVWTIQILRGFILAIAILIAAPFISDFYNEPALALILPLWALNTAVLGFKSVALYTYDKNLVLHKQVIMEIGTQLMGAIVMITWAWYSPTVWALVAGTLFTGFISTLMSYLMFTGHHSRIRFDLKAMSEIVSFGKWIFLSTAIGYIANQGDKLIMGAWLTMTELGVYSIAAVLASVPNMLIGNLSGRFLQPLFRKHIDDATEHKISHVRLRLNAVVCAGCCLLAWLGQLIVDVLYDDRYIAAGWMLQLLAIRSIGFTLNATLTPYLLAKGDSFSQFKYQCINSTYLVIGMIIGAQVSTFGIIIAYALGPIICHPVLVYITRKHALPDTKYDLFLLAGFVALVCIGWYLGNATILEQAYLFASEAKELLN